MSVIEDIRIARGDFLYELTVRDRDRARLKLYLGRQTAEELRNECASSVMPGRRGMTLPPLPNARIFDMPIAVCPRMGPCGMKIERTE